MYLMTNFNFKYISFCFSYKTVDIVSKKKLIKSVFESVSLNGFGISVLFEFQHYWV